MFSKKGWEDILPLEEARFLLLRSISPIERVEEVGLLEAAGRVLARGVSALGDLPPFDRSTHDGYALRSRDGPGRRRVIGRIFAGDRPSFPLGMGEAVEVATGAPIPEGSDSVVPREEVEIEGDSIRPLSPPDPWENVQRRGSDIRRGEVLLEKGTLVGPCEIALLSSSGEKRVKVFARPRVLLLPTGDELGEISEGKVPDVNGPTLTSLLRSHGCDVTLLPRLPDERTLLEEEVRKAVGSFDLLVVTGGSSVGERDHASQILSQEGELLFHGLRIRPGRPTLASIHRSGTVLVGVPGNPSSAFVVGVLLLVPLVRRLGHLPPWEPKESRRRLASSVRSPPQRALILPVRIDSELAYPVFRESGAVTSFARADGWVEIPEGSELGEGAEVVVKIWR